MTGPRAPGAGKCLRLPAFWALPFGKLHAMRAFNCDHCGHLVFFDSTCCVHCGSTLAFVPEWLRMAALTPALPTGAAAVPAVQALPTAAPATELWQAMDAGHTAPAAGGCAATTRPTKRATLPCLRTIPKRCAFPAGKPAGCRICLTRQSAPLESDRRRQAPAVLHPGPLAPDPPGRRGGARVQFWPTNPASR
jgi:hypothetical protein